MKCAQVRELFGAYWDDEITQAEREWIESHFAGCTACREEYEDYSRTLELIGTLPRVEAAPELLERVLARTRRASVPPDRLPARGVAWVPATAAAALLVLAIASLSPWVRLTPGNHRAQVETPVAAREPVRVAHPSRAVGEASAARARSRAASGEAALAIVADSLFDHSEDVDFILDPGTVRRGHVRPVAPRTPSVQGERAVITF
jgi:predicted anti-sigma-YlaC factor YlaD